MTAVPPASRPATISPSARATPSRSPKPSRCSAPALVIRPTWAAPLAPAPPLRRDGWRRSRSRPTACAAVRRSSVSGTPMWLLRLPRVARQVATPREDGGEVISLTVVLPLLPATPTTGALELAAPAAGRARQRQLPVVDFDQRQWRIRHRTIDDGCDRTGGRGRCQEFVAVETRRRAAPGRSRPARSVRVSVLTPAQGMVLAGVAATAQLREFAHACASCAHLPSCVAHDGAGR